MAEIPPLERFVREQLEQFIAATLGDSPSAETIRSAVTEHRLFHSTDAALLESALSSLLIARFGAEPPRQGQIHPRLLVDWGELPQLGHQARPAFSLICPEHCGEPQISIRIDRELDHDPDDPLLTPRRDQEGIWSFSVPFRLTSSGRDCLPGQYIIDVEATIRAAVGDYPRFFRTRIRLHIPSASASGPRVLEIEGDGQSVVNLHGHDLRSFSRVVLRGGDQSLINLQNLSGGSSADNNSPVPAAPRSVFEYELKPDLDRQQRLPKVRRDGRRDRLDSLTLEFPNHKRVHLFARRRVTLGRNRDNDIVTRFLPRSPEHDQLSRNISRTHMAVELCSEGVLLQDQSSKGIELDCAAIEGERLLGAIDVGFDLQVDLAPILGSDDFLSLGLQLFGGKANSRERNEQFSWDEICFSLLRERPTQLWQTAARSGIDACRIRRLRNLADMEEYVLLFREVLLGSSNHQDAIVLDWISSDSPIARIIHAGRSFWLHVYSGTDVTVDGAPVDAGEMIPLARDQQLSVHGRSLRVLPLSQAFLET